MMMAIQNKQGRPERHSLAGFQFNVCEDLDFEIGLIGLVPFTYAGVCVCVRMWGWVAGWLGGWVCVCWGGKGIAGSLGILLYVVPTTIKN